MGRIQLRQSAVRRHHAPGPGDKKAKRKGMTAWVKKSIEQFRKSKRVVIVHPIDKWVLMLLAEGAIVRNLGDVHWLATEDRSEGKGTGRHIACFILDPTRSIARPACKPPSPEAPHHA
jgi:hypothetical protein